MKINVGNETMYCDRYRKFQAKGRQFFIGINDTIDGICPNVELFEVKRDGTLDLLKDKIYGNYAADCRTINKYDWHKKLGTLRKYEVQNDTFKLSQKPSEIILYSGSYDYSGCEDVTKALEINGERSEFQYPHKYDTNKYIIREYPYRKNITDSKIIEVRYNLLILDSVHVYLYLK